MLNKTKYYLSLLVAGAAMVATAPFAHASEFSLPTPDDQTLGGDESVTDVFSSLGGSIVNIIFLIAGLLAVIYLLWSGVQYITAGGNQDKVKAARQGIINAVIGIVVIMAAFFIIRVATSTRSLFDEDGQIEGGPGFGG